MVKANPSFSTLRKTYIFSTIDEKLAALKALPRPLINLSVGDVALPLVPTLAQAITQATEEMTTPEGRRGYGPCEGYLFLKEAICHAEYARLGFTPHDLFISDGTNSDCVNLLEIFDPQSVVAVPDPAYPAYLDAALMAGKKTIRMPCPQSQDFSPRPPQEKADLVYLCTPNNPTGTALKKTQLQEWVNWAKAHKAILLIDNVYNCFVTSSDIPSSIYEIPGAKEVAIEMRSFSKVAGFTGLRCAYLAFPKELKDDSGQALQPLWTRRVNAKFNGVAYPIQKGAQAFFTPDAQRETKAQIEIYKTAARLLCRGLKALGQSFAGGVDAPYIWWKVPGQASSWDFFDFLLKECQILTIPGEGFGPSGEGYIRVSCFTTPETATEVISRLSYALQSRTRT